MTRLLQEQNSQNYRNSFTARTRYGPCQKNSTPVEVTWRKINYMRQRCELQGNVGRLPLTGCDKMSECVRVRESGTHPAGRQNEREEKRVSPLSCRPYHRRVDNITIYTKMAVEVVEFCCLLLY